MTQHCQDPSAIAGWGTIGIPVVREILDGGLVLGHVLCHVRGEIWSHKLGHAPIGVKVPSKPEEDGGQVKCVGSLVQQRPWKGDKVLYAHYLQWNLKRSSTTSQLRKDTGVQFPLFLEIQILYIVIARAYGNGILKIVTAPPNSA